MMAVVVMMIDDEDRRLVDNSVRQTKTVTVAPTPTICTNQRRT